MDDVEAQQDFDDFFEEVFCELEDKVKCSTNFDLRYDILCITFWLVATRQHGILYMAISMLNENS